MEDDKPILPLVVTSATGVGGVSPRFSILQEAIEEQAQVLEKMTQFIAPRALDAESATEALRASLEEAAQSFDRIYQEAATSAQSVNDALLEAARINVEHALRYLHDLGSANTPSDAISIQTEYAGRQFMLFAQQLHDIQVAIKGFFSVTADTAKAGLLAPPEWLNTR